MIRLVVTDVDNTIVKEGTPDLNPGYIETIKKLSAKGIKVVIASGRQLASVRRLFAEVEDLVWFIVDGGTVIKTDKGVETISVIPKQWLREMWQDIEAIDGMDAMLCAADVSYGPNEESEMFQRMVNNYKYDIVSLGGWENIPEVPITKVSLYRPTEIERYTRDYFLPKWERRLHCTIAGQWWLDCMMPGVNKGVALKAILDRLGIGPEEVLATGDNMNDMEMIQLAGTGLCVENGNDKLKAVADGIIPGYSELGVLKEWNKLL